MTSDVAGGRVVERRADPRLRLQYLGDVILTLPAVRAIRDRFPLAEVDYLSESRGRGRARRGTFFRAGVPRSGKTGGARRTAADDLGASRSEIRGGGRLVFQSEERALGPAYRRAAQGRRRSARPETPVHPSRGCAGIGPERDRPSFILSETARDRGGRDAAGVEPHGGRKSARRGSARRVRSRDGTGKEGGNPGGKWEVKRWPADYFAALAKTLTERGVPCGGSHRSRRGGVPRRGSP